MSKKDRHQGGGPAKYAVVMKLAALLWAVAACPTLTTGAAPAPLPGQAADQLVRVVCVRAIPKKVADAIAFAAPLSKELDLDNPLSDLVEEFEELDQDRPLQYEFYVHPGTLDTWSIGVVLPADQAEVEELAGEKFEKAPGGTGLLVLDDDEGFARFDQGYCFYLASDHDPPLPEPVIAATIDDMMEEFHRTRSTYDWSVTVTPREFSPAGRRAFISLIKQTGLTGFQKLDGEGELTYRLRRAPGDVGLAILETLLTDCEEAVFGFKVDTNRGVGTVDLVMTADPDSNLDKWMATFGDLRNPLSQTLDPQGALAVSLSLPLGKTLTESGLKVVDALEQELQASLPLNAQTAADLTTPLREQLKSGLLNLVLQVNREDYYLSIQGGLRLNAGDTFAGAWQQLLTSMGVGEELQIAADKYEDWPLHRGHLDGGLDLFPGDAELFLAATPRGLWFAASQSGAADRLKLLLTEVHGNRKRQDDPTAIQMVWHPEQWMDKPPTVQLTSGEGSTNGVQQADGDTSPPVREDRVSIRLDRIKNGLRLRARFEKRAVPWMFQVLEILEGLPV